MTDDRTSWLLTTFGVVVAERTIIAFDLAGMLDLRAGIRTTIHPTREDIFATLTAMPRVVHSGQTHRADVQNITFGVSGFAFQWILVTTTQLMHSGEFSTSGSP
jgi:hypothetical protein